MDGLRFSVEEAEYSLPAYEAAVEAPTGAVLDDRRTYVRAFNRWVQLLRGRTCPDIRDVAPESLKGPNTLLLDLRAGSNDPVLHFVGAALLEECGTGAIATLAQIPAQSLLSCLASHYRAVLELGEPIGFDGEHRRPDGCMAAYRGILLPYTSGGEAVDLIHGMINWRELADTSVATDIAFEMGRACASLPGIFASSVWGSAPPAPVMALCEPPQPELPLYR